MAVPGFTAERSLRSFRLSDRLTKAKSADLYSRLRPMQSSETGLGVDYDFPGIGMPWTAGAGAGDDASADGTTDGTAGDATTDGTTGDGTSYDTADDTSDDGTLYAGPDAGDPPWEPGTYQCGDLTCECFDGEGCDAMDQDGVCEPQPPGAHYAYGGCVSTLGCNGAITYPNCPCTCGKLRTV